MTTGRPIICVDLDGVLAQYSGWKGPGVLGDPIPGAVEFTHALYGMADVVIWSVRCNEQVAGDPEVARKEYEGIRAWLDKHRFSYTRVHRGQGKPLACAYVDDRAVGCRPVSPLGPKGLQGGQDFACAVGQCSVLVARHAGELRILARNRRDDRRKAASPERSPKSREV